MGHWSDHQLGFVQLMIHNALRFSFQQRRV